MRCFLCVDEHQDDIIAQTAFVGELASLRSGFQEGKGASAERRMAAADFNQLAVKAEQVQILIFRVPFHAFAAARIAFAVHADFVTVINARCAHEGELEQRGKLLLIFVPFSQSQKTRRIMAVQQVEGYFAGLQRVAGKLFANSVGEAFGIQCAIDKKVEHGIGEGIIHDRIEFVAFQPR
ncbi:hypothetical protein D3C73_659470 [compost metagenome]